MKYTLRQLAEIADAQLIGNGNTEIEYLLTDSRAVSFPEESLFVALKTLRNDGHNYIASLCSANVRNFLVSKKPESSLKANFLVVDDTLKALQKIAAYHRSRFTCPIIGITGSNGKTIVKEWLNRLLQEDYNITRSPRSYNSQIGVPLSVLEMNEQTQLGIFEAGISQTHEMQRLSKIVKPTIGIFTHLGDAHQENFPSLKEKCEEKLALFTSADVLIYGKDDKLVDITISQANLKAQLLSWGQIRNADVFLQDISINEDGYSVITYSYKGKKSKVTVPFCDEASKENALNCLTLMLYLGIDDKVIAKRMMNLESVAMRLEVKEGLNNCVVINDTYNSDLGSLSIALDFHAQQANAKRKKRTLILSDIFQSGKADEELYKEVAQLIQNKGIDKLIAIGEKLEDFKGEFHLKEQFFYASTDAFLQSKELDQFSDEVILLKGARRFRFEDISEKIEAIAHQTVLEVDLNALIHNVDYFRSFLKPETKMVSMVKANAYGSGDVEVARALQNHGCDYLAVAVADEGANLRNEGINIPIIVMNPEIGGLAKILAYKLEPEIYSFSMLEAFCKETEKQGLSKYPIHVKIDTGMHRLGFNLEQVDEVIDVLKKQKNLLVRSVFSHFVGSDEARFDDFTEEQVRRFRSVTDKFDKAFSHKILKHILNSAGIERFNQYQFDMVRLGIGHYGMSAVDNSRLQEVCTLKTTILQIRKVQPSETIGYSRNGKLTRESVIGAIPIGYADGFDRKLGNRVGKVLVNGKFAPIVGNICMDVCMIDLTDIDAKEGDTVILFGKGYSINEVAKQLGTISYEVLTGVSRRVKRVYFKE